MSIFASGAKEDMVTSRRGEKITRGLKHAAARRDLSSACAWGDDFTVSGFEDSDRNDGCYSVLDYHFDGVFNGVPRFTLDSREKEEKRGLIFTAKDMDQGPDGPYWTIEDLASGNVCVDFHFSKPTETHPTEVVAWECQGGGSASMFAEASFSTFCGCSSGDKSREGVGNVTGSTKPVGDPVVAVGSLFAFAVFLGLGRSLLRLNRRSRREAIL